MAEHEALRYWPPLDSTHWKVVLSQLYSFGGGGGGLGDGEGEGEGDGLGDGLGELQLLQAATKVAQLGSSGAHGLHCLVALPLPDDDEFTHLNCQTAVKTIIYQAGNWFISFFPPLLSNLDIRGRVAVGTGRGLVAAVGVRDGRITLVALRVEKNFYINTKIPWHIYIYFPEGLF
jgi:hypothetical protein